MLDTMQPRERKEGNLDIPAASSSALDITRLKRDRAQSISAKLQVSFDILQQEAMPDVEPDEEQPEPNPEASLKLAKLGIKLALSQKEAIRLERNVIVMEQETGISRAHTSIEPLYRKYLSIEHDLWGHERQKLRYESNSSISRSLDPRATGLSEILLALYQKGDGFGNTKPAPSNWRSDALQYYQAHSAYDPNPQEDDDPCSPRGFVWCHVSGMWYCEDQVKAAHIVPFSFHNETVGDILFGNRTESLDKAGNALMLKDSIKSWFNEYSLVIVPADATEVSIKRWRMDILDQRIRRGTCGLGRIEEFDGKELVFRGEKRPIPRFLYFHFIMALIRMRDLNRKGWQDVWAKYHQQRPFPTPTQYMRKSMLLALGTHFGSAHMHIVDSWIKDNGFDMPLIKLTSEEITEAARRIHETINSTIVRRKEKERRVLYDESDNSEEEFTNAMFEAYE